MPKRSLNWILLAAGAVVLVFAAIALADRNAEGEAAAGTSEPAHVTPIGKTGLSRVTLTPSAAERLGLDTGAVRADGSRLVVPYAALLYDEHGKTWVYTRPKPLTFVRAPVRVASIRGTRAILADGPRAGTIVATVGAAELLGTEFEVDH